MVHVKVILTQLIKFQVNQSNLKTTGTIKCTLNRISVSQLQVKYNSSFQKWNMSHITS